MSDRDGGGSLDPATTACGAFQAAQHALLVGRDAMWALEGRDGYDDVQRLMDELMRIEIRAQRKRAGGDSGR